MAIASGHRMCAIAVFLAAAVPAGAQNDHGAAGHGLQERLISSDYTAPSIDCGTVIVGLGGFFAVTLAAASGYPSGCAIEIINNDPDAGKAVSVNGLAAAGFGYSGCGLSNICPFQSVKYLSTAAGWVLARNPGPWRPQTSPTLYVAPAGVNTNDCLSVSRPCTLAFTCVARANIDSSANSAGGVVSIQLADGTYSGSSGATLCQITGNYGAASPGLTFINGNCMTPTAVQINAPAYGTGLFTKDGGETEVSCLTFNGNGGSVEISGAQFSIVDVRESVVFGCAGSNGLGLSFSQSASLNIDDSYTVLAPCTQSSHISLAANANVLANASNPVVTISGGTASYSAGFFHDEGGYWNIGAMSFAYAGGAAVSGVRFASYSMSALGTNSHGCVQTNGVTPAALGIPGNAVQPFPVGSCTDFNIATTFSTLPTCSTGIEGSQYAVTDSAVTTFGAIVAGGGTNHVLAYCDGTHFTVAGN